MWNSVPLFMGETRRHAVTAKDGEREIVWEIPQAAELSDNLVGMRAPTPLAVDVTDENGHEDVNSEVAAEA